MEVEGRKESAPWRWSLLSSVFLLNVFLPSVVLSYGAVLVHTVAEGSDLGLEVASPSVLTLVFCLTHCWCRDAADSWGGNVGYRVLAALGLLLLVAGVILCAFTAQIYHLLFYGVLAGVGLSMIAAQVDAVVFETYDVRLGVVRGLCAFGQAVGLFLFPHLILLLMDVYGASMFYLVYGGLMLQTLPAMMFLKVENKALRPMSFSRYGDLAKTYSLFNNDLSNGCYTNELQLHDLSKKCWQSPADDNVHRDSVFDPEDGDGRGANAATITPPPSPEEKRRNIFGVEILPEIPEESEASDDSDAGSAYENRMDQNKRRLSSAIKRLSLMGDNLDGYIAKQFRRESLSSMEYQSKEYTEIEVVYDNVAPMTEIRHEKIFNSLSFRCNTAFANMKRRVCIPSYRLYRLKRRIQYFFFSINDTFVKPLVRSIFFWKFYPALMLCFSNLCLRLSLVLLPIITLQVRPAISLTEMNFLMSLHSFTWICFLLVAPWVIQMPKSSFKYITLIGLSVSTSAFFVIAGCYSHDSVSIGCVIAGFGFGALSFCWQDAAKEFVGARMWPKIVSTMETLSAILLALLVLALMYYMREEQGLQLCMFILGTILSFITTVWFVIGTVAFYTSKVKSLRLTRKFCLK